MPEGAAQDPAPGLKPSAALAAVIGGEPLARTEVIKKLWDYIKANGLQDAEDKRAINADAKLKPCSARIRSRCSSWPASSAST